MKVVKINWEEKKPPMLEAMLKPLGDMDLELVYTDSAGFCHLRLPIEVHGSTMLDLHERHILMPS